MEFKLNPLPAGAGARTKAGAVAADEGSFSISASPVVHEPEPNESFEIGDAELPRSYGTQSVWLMPRDPFSIFAYWDVDWHRAFGAKLPIDRKAHLRMFNVDGAQLSEIEVEPMAGSCYVTVADADESYSAELGYYSPAGTWNSLATSPVAITPPDVSRSADAADFATVPFHLSFQHMVDLLRIYKQENESLTAMLKDFREQDAPNGTSPTRTSEQQELARVIDEAATRQPAPAPSTPSSPNLWSRQKLADAIGLGHSSPAGGFGGSSRHFGS